MEILNYKFWIVFVSVLVAALVPESKAAATKLIIDQDGGADDAMAIFMALLYEQYFDGPAVLALTTAHGNVDEEQSFINAQRILDTARRRDVPIYRGSNDSLLVPVASDGYFGADGLGDNNFKAIEPIDAQKQHAALGLIELTNIYPGEITLVAIGALTNVALAIRLDPDFINRLSHLYVGAGNVYSDTEQSPEYNAEQDAEAYQIVVQEANPEKVTIVPFSQVRTRNIPRQWRKEVLGAIQTTIMKAQNAYEKVSLSKSKSNAWSLLDPVVMGLVLNDTIVGDVKYSQNGIHLCGSSRGINTNNFTTIEEANVAVVNSIIPEKYQDLLISIFSAELQ